LNGKTTRVRKELFASCGHWAVGALGEHLRLFFLLPVNSLGAGNRTDHFVCLIGYLQPAVSSFVAMPVPVVPGGRRHHHPRTPFLGPYKSCIGPLLLTVGNGGKPTGAFASAGTRSFTCRHLRRERATARVRRSGSRSQRSPSYPVVFPTIFSPHPL
jgi:hypothetical protein